MVRSALGARPPDRPEMTLEEWAALDEDEPGELVEGRLEEEEMPTFLHEAVVSWLLAALRAWIVPRGGWVFGSEAKYAVLPRGGRKPDLSVYLPGTRVPAKGSSLSRLPPSIVVEVISSRPRDARRDRIDKLREYAAFGVRYYWLIDPRLRVLEVLELADRPVIVLAASSGALAVPGCEELTLDLDGLWSEVDRLPEESDDSHDAD